MTELTAYLQEIRPQFTAATYNLITNNCNNFSDTVVQFLCNHRIPSYIVDLPSIVFNTPMGSMLRPMIENMQRQINSAGGGSMDPFAAGNGGMTGAGIPLQQAFSSTFQGHQQPQQQGSSVASTPAKVVMATLEELPLLSAENNSATLDAISNKLLNTKKSSGDTNLLLDEETRACVERIRTALKCGESTSVHHSPEDFHSILTIISEHLTCQMSALFLLRLMVLSPSVLGDSTRNVVDTVVDKLSSGIDAFSGVPACVMALCTLSNLIGNEKARVLIFDLSLENKLIDSALAYMGHERAEVRQISSTLIYNFTLICTSTKPPASGWCPPGTATVVAVNGVAEDESLPELAVQILW